MRRILITVIAMLMVLSFAGCNGANETSVTTGTNGDSAFLASKDPLGLTIHMNVYDRIVFKDEWPVFKKAAELTNISLKGTVSEVSSDSTQSFNIMIASGNLPDIVNYQHGDLQKYGEEGAFIPLNDLIDKHAPNIKKFLEENPDVKRYLTSRDGNIYDIGNVRDGKVSIAYFVRQDWLDKLNLSVPTTMDELHGVLKAFAEKDPNGNGKKDEVPYFLRASDDIMSFVTFNGGHVGWYVDDNGKVHYGPAEREYFETIELLSKWYAEGLIDKEIFTRGNKSREELFGNNLGGMTRDWVVSTTGFNTTLREKIPGFHIAAMLPPKDKNGKVHEATSRDIMSGYGWAISHNNKHPEETMKYFDFWFTPEGRRLANFGIEGEHYTMENGKAMMTDNIVNGNKPVLDMLNEIGAVLPFGYQSDYWYEQQVMDDEAVKAVEMYEPILDKLFPTLQFSEDERKTLTKMTAIKTYIDEIVQSIILKGNTNNLTYEAYRSEIEKMEYFDIQKAHQDAYERYMK